MRTITHCLLLFLAATTTGCTTFTGIPSHGGGKRFFVEQELISASSRAAAKSIDLSPLKGKRCAIRLVSIGDQGGGNLIGGRYEWQAAIRGSYAANPPTRTQNQFPVLNSSTITRDGAGAVLSAITAQNPLNFPNHTESRSEGSQANIGGGFAYNGTPSYQAAAFINPNDAIFLDGVLREACFLQGVVLTTPRQAEYTIFVTVDVFGTHRSRTEMHVFNQERLRAKTALQVTVLDKKGEVFLPPQTTSWESDYRERYVLWCGPFEIDKRVYKSDDLMVDFQHSFTPASIEGSPVIMEFGDEPKRNDRATPKTRPNQLIRPRTSPQPNRPEDVEKELIK